ncbi:MAG: JAB domain-containing protein [Bacteroidetes bacterium]|nr:JAB domain-containing protein [Bacteroidota bacterium]
MEAKSNYRNKLRQFETSLNLAEIEVRYKTKQKEKVTINRSKDAFEILYSLYNKDTIEFLEQFYLLLLNRANKVLGWINLSIGGTTGTVVDIKVIFALALKTNASGILLSHNHPSQSLNPSEEDKKLTKSISDAGKLFNIRLLDHIIIASDEAYYSFADEGMLT